MKETKSQKVYKFIFCRLLGWHIRGVVPYGVKKYLFIGIPHTSNWDFLYAWLAIKLLGLDVKIFVKDAFFVWPLTYACRFFGVAPVNRRESTNFVDSIARQFDETDRLAAVITPEGTRQYQATLKSGYYYLAKKGKASIVLAGIDYGTKSITLVKARPPMDTFEEDAANLVAFSKKISAYHPDQTYKS